MSVLDVDKARADYAEWLNGTDDPPTLTEEEARLLSFRITAHHFPNLLAAYLSLRDAVAHLADEYQARADADPWDDTSVEIVAERLRSLLPQEGPK